MTSDALGSDGRPTFVCRHCGHAMIVVQIFARGESIRAPPQAIDAMNALSLPARCTHVGSSRGAAAIPCPAHSAGYSLGQAGLAVHDVRALPSTLRIGIGRSLALHNASTPPARNSNRHSVRHQPRACAAVSSLEACPTPALRSGHARGVGASPGQVSNKPKRLLQRRTSAIGPISDTQRTKSPPRS